MAPISSQTEEAKKDYLVLRAKRCDETASSMLAYLLDFWLAMGAPALCESDALEAALPVPPEIRGRLRPYWQHLVPFDAQDDRQAVRKEAAAVLRHAAAHANRGAGKLRRGDKARPSSERA